MSRTISICIPTYERVGFTIDSIAKVIDDPRISEIIIVDDHSSEDVYHELLDHYKNQKKVKLSRNYLNIDCYRNKKNAIQYATNEWCILLDSDNVMGTDYIDRVFAIENWELDCVYMPDFAQPHFDYRKFSGSVITRENIGGYIEDVTFQTALNTANYFVNKSTYLSAFNPDVDPHTSDSIYMTYRFLEQGNKLCIVDGLSYFHRVHQGSHYQNNVHKTGNFHTETLQKLRNL